MSPENTSPPISIREELRRRTKTEENRGKMNMELRQIEQQEKELRIAVNEGKKTYSFRVINIIEHALEYIGCIMESEIRSHLFSPVTHASPKQEDSTNHDIQKFAEEREKLKRIINSNQKDEILRIINKMKQLLVDLRSSVREHMPDDTRR